MGLCSITTFITTFYNSTSNPIDLINTIWKNESKTLIILALIAVFFQSTVWPITVQMAESLRKTYYVQIINVSLVFLHFLVIISLWYFKLLALPFLFIVITIEWLIASLLLLNIFKKIILKFLMKIMMMIPLKIFLMNFGFIAALLFH